MPRMAAAQWRDSASQASRAGTLPAPAAAVLYMYVYMYVHAWVHIQIYIYIFVYAYVCMFSYILYTHIYAAVSMTIPKPF